MSENIHSEIIKIKIIPNSSKNEIVKTDDCLKIKLTAQPVDNKANKALVNFLSKELKIPKSDIEIIKGHTCREKTLRFNSAVDEKIAILLTNKK